MLKDNIKILDEWKNISNEARPKVRYWVPAAAIDEADLIQEIHQLKERGFGGVEVVTLSNLPSSILKGEDGWGTDHWNRMVQVISETTEKLGMSMDMTNGPMWPISMPTIKNADDPAALCELTYGVLECPKDGHYKGKLPARKTTHEEGTPILIQVMAYLENEDKVLVKDSYQDLNHNVSGSDDQAVLECTLPAVTEGSKWLIFAFFQQPAAHKTGLDQYYVVDHFSKAGAKACEEYWTPIMEMHNYPSMESIFCDSLEYHVCTEWSPNFPEEFEKRRGYTILPYLPFIGMVGTFPEGSIPGYRLEQPELSDMINMDYTEVLTQCFCEYHLSELEGLANKYGKTIRYQVAYNKPLEVERSAAYVGIPENEAFGRPTMDCLKTMAAAAHLTSKRRYSFECAAEFGNAYGQNYEDLFWWVKRALMSGMNAQVLHGAAYSGAYHGMASENGTIPGVQWPGYESFGKFVSNYWNRTLSPEDARGCLDTIARLNTVFLKKAKVDCAVYRESYLNTGLGSEFWIYADGGLLSNAGYTYETVSPTLLELPVCRVSDKLMDKDGVGYKCLIVPEQEAISYSFLLKVQELLQQQFPIIWIGNRPCRSLYYSEWSDSASIEKWNNLMDTLWVSGDMIHISRIEDVPMVLEDNNILPNVMLDGTMDIITAMRVDEEKEMKYYSLYAYNRIEYTPENPEMRYNFYFNTDTTKGMYERPGKKSQRIIDVHLKGKGQVYQCNPWNGELTPINFNYKNGYCSGKVAIEEDEMLLLTIDETSSVEGMGLNTEKRVLREISVAFSTLELERFEPDDDKETSFLRSHFSKDKKEIQLKSLQPWHLLDSTLDKFAGRGTYYGTIFIDQIENGRQYILQLGDISDTFHVFINGMKTDFPDQVLKAVNITNMILVGENQLKVEVVSDLYNCVQGNEGDVRLPYIQKKYGIWETEDKRCRVLVIE